MEYLELVALAAEILLLGFPGMLAFYIYTDQTYTPMPYSNWITILAPNRDKLVLAIAFGLAMKFYIVSAQPYGYVCTTYLITHLKKEQT